MFHASDEMRQAIKEAAKLRKIPMSELMRISIAKEIDFDLTKEPKSGRPLKYATPEARKEATREKAKKKRDATNNIMRAIQQGYNEEGLQALIESLADDLGVRRKATK